MKLWVTPAQFNGTAVLQKHGVKVYTSQQVAAAIPAARAQAQARLIDGLRCR